MRNLLGLEKKGVEGDETLRAAFGLLGRLAGHFPDAQDVEVLITAAAPSDNPQTTGPLPTSTGKQDKTDGAQQVRGDRRWGLCLCVCVEASNLKSFEGGWPGWEGH